MARPKKTRIYKGGSPTKTKVKQGYMRKSIRSNTKRISPKRRGG
jgi:hypothetical protein